MAEVLLFDNRWDGAESLPTEERRNFLELEITRIISEFDKASTQESEYSGGYIHLEIDPSELGSSQLPEEVKEYILDHFNDPGINRYQQIYMDGKSIQLWGNPKIILRVAHSQVLNNSRINLATQREVSTKSVFGAPPRFSGRAVYVGIPSPDIDYSLVVGIKSDFVAYMQRGKDRQMEAYISDNKWLVAKELFRFTNDAVLSHRPTPVQPQTNS